MLSWFGGDLVGSGEALNLVVAQHTWDPFRDDTHAVMLARAGTRMASSAV